MKKRMAGAQTSQESADFRCCLINALSRMQFGKSVQHVDD